MEQFHAIRRLPPYVFAEVNRQKAEARAAGRDVIDLGMGNPDLPTPSFIVDKLCEVSRDPKTHRYSASRGIAGLRKAQARYYERRFDVKLDPETEVIVTLGSKEGFANLATAITAPGDVILAPNPSYPIHAFGFVMAGGVMRALPSAPTEAVFREAEKAIKYSVPKPIAMVINYPSNPTAEVADLEFYRDAVAFAKKHGLILISDLAYAEIYFDDTPPPSVLQVPGAKDVAVEFTSMSKTFSMPGWRIGFAVGKPELVAALGRVKSYLDYGAFTPIQVAGITALDNSERVAEEVRGVYAKRLEVMVESFANAGWAIPRPKASMFAWAPIPDEFDDSLAFAKHLLAVGDVALSPGVGFGEKGEGFVRIALVENEQRIRQAAKGIGRLFRKRAA